MTTPGTLWALLEEAVARDGDAPAVIERRDGEVVRRLTFSELAGAAVDAAALLAEHGVRRGDVVAVWLPNWTEAIALQYALARLGAANLGINTRYGVHELEHLLAHGRPVGVVAPAEFLGLDFDGRLRAAVAERADVDAPWVAVVRGSAADRDVGGGSWDFAPASGALASEPAGVPGDRLNYFTTSGSTGVPKLAGHAQSSVVAHARNAARALDFRPGDVVLGVLPLSGVFGFNAVMACLAAGGAVLLEPVFDPAVTLAGMDELRVTHAIAGDDLLARVKDAWEQDRRPLEALRRGGIADFAGRAGEVTEWAERELGATFSGVYGSSELFALTAVWPQTLALPDRGRGGGHPVAEEIEVRVADPSTGAVLGPGEPGELQFRGYNVLDGYLGNPEAARTAFTADGWFRSGDLGELTGDGCDFVYVCRAGDALRLRGFLVEPAEIERFLASHDAVDVAKVVGVRGAAGGDVAVAYVTARAGRELDADALLAFARDRLAPFKVPARINVIDAFPVTTGTNGTKIRTGELRRWATEQVAEPSG